VAPGRSFHRERLRQEELDSMACSTRSGFGLLAAFASCLSLPGCLGVRDDAPHAASVSDVEHAVFRLMTADDDSDLATVLDCYTRDALLLAPDGTTFQGSDAIGGHYLDVFSKLVMKIRATPAETVVAGRFAWQRGEVSGTLTMNDGGAPQAVRDRYLMVLAFEDGRWRVARLMWQPVEKS
jgi:ketosteroid isomerase-like protein